VEHGSFADGDGLHLVGLVEQREVVRLRGHGAVLRHVGREVVGLFVGRDDHARVGLEITPERAGAALGRPDDEEVGSVHRELGAREEVIGDRKKRRQT
jgi:hypothetical protein